VRRAEEEYLHACSNPQEAAAFPRFDAQWSWHTTDATDAGHWENKKNVLIKEGKGVLRTFKNECIDKMR
jgi:hypothetical protein